MDLTIIVEDQKCEPIFTLSEESLGLFKITFQGSLQKRRRTKRMRAWVYIKMFYRQIGLIHIKLPKTITAPWELHKLKSDKNPSMKNISRQKVPTLARNLLLIHSFWERENQFSSIELHWGILFIYQGRPQVQE